MNKMFLSKWEVVLGSLDRVNTDYYVVGGVNIPRRMHDIRLVQLDVKLTNN